MASDSDDLEQALQENLKLRSELAANVVKADAASQRGGIAYRLGRVLYWLCSIAAGLWFASSGIWVTFGQPRFGELPMSEWPPLAWLVAVTFLTIPALVLYGLGCAFRYVLSGGYQFRAQEGKKPEL